MQISLPSRKRDQISKILGNANCCHEMSIVEGAKLIGTLISAGPVVEYSMIHIRAMEVDKVRALLKVGSYDGSMKFSKSSLDDLICRQTTIENSISQKNYRSRN